MNKSTYEYLKYLETLPKNGRNPNYINHGSIFREAQNGDMNALNYLFENNQYLIAETIKNSTQFIDTSIDIQTYIDFLTDMLIAEIKSFDPSKHIAFRSFAKRSLFLHLKHFNQKYKKFVRIQKETKPISAFDRQNQEETYPILKDTQNVLLDSQDYISYNENIAIENASNLWNKLKPLMTEKELNQLYQVIALHKPYNQLANENNSSQQMISFRTLRTMSRLKKEVNLANEIYKAYEIEHKDLRDVMEAFNIKVHNKIDYYVQLYKYLYLDDDLPTGVYTYGYLMYATNSKSQNNKEEKAIKELV